MQKRPRCLLVGELRVGLKVGCGKDVTLRSLSAKRVSAGLSAIETVRGPRRNIASFIRREMARSARSSNSIVIYGKKDIP
jgi:hypothetical protein